MEARPWKIREYLAPDGSNPFREWLRSLSDARARAKIRVRLNRLRLGNFGDSKSLNEGLHELRVDVGPGYRVYFGTVDRSIVLLLCGGDKRSQTRDIARARSLWRDYKERKREATGRGL